MTGTFISLEGGEGSGKTTVIQVISTWLEERKLSYVLTREPGGIRIAERIRKIILDVSHTEMDSRTEALLYAAARRQHLVEKVVPWLSEGKVVICDRFVDSSLVYQGHARGLGVEDILQVNLFATDGLFPHLTLWLDVSPEVGLSRVLGNSTREVNRLDLEELDFHLKVQEGYRKLHLAYPDRIKRVNADLSLDEVVAQVIQHLEHYFQL